MGFSVTVPVPVPVSAGAFVSGTVVSGLSVVTAPSVVLPFTSTWISPSSASNAMKLILERSFAET